VHLHVRALTTADAAGVGEWRYPPPYAVYDVDGHALIEELDRYWAVVDPDDQLVGFYCTGTAARVPGLPIVDGTVDLGMGMRPDLVGAGLGAAFGATVMEHVAAEHGSRALRVVVQSWNERSARLARRLGFSDAGVHAVGAVEYRVLVTTSP
jgi:RimJ/RimL family protein N-acetyltransferase